MERNGWWEKVKMPDFLKIFEMHKEDFAGIFGQFAEYKSFDDIIKVEFDRWKNTDDA
jgi:alanyl-tRNA synthetase